MLDSLSEIRLLAQSSLRYRRQILALKHYFAQHGATVLLLDDLTTEVNDKTVHSVAHGVIRLEELAPDYGAERRRAARHQIPRPALSAAAITTSRSRPAAWSLSAPRRVRASRPASSARSLTSGIAGLDALLGGGVERGSSTLILGPAGTGKSLFALSSSPRRCERGEKAALFIFDEELGLLFDRMRSDGHRPGGHAATPDR